MTTHAERKALSDARYRLLLTLSGIVAVKAYRQRVALWFVAGVMRHVFPLEDWIKRIQERATMSFVDVRASKCDAEGCGTLSINGAWIGTCKRCGKDTCSKHGIEVGVGNPTKDERLHYINLCLPCSHLVRAALKEALVKALELGKDG